MVTMPTCSSAHLGVTTCLVAVSQRQQQHQITKPQLSFYVRRCWGFHFAYSCSQEHFGCVCVSLQRLLKCPAVLLHLYVLPWCLENWTSSPLQGYGVIADSVMSLFCFFSELAVDSTKLLWIRSVVLHRWKTCCLHVKQHFSCHPYFFFFTLSMSLFVSPALYCCLALLFFMIYGAGLPIPSLLVLMNQTPCLAQLLFARNEEDPFQNCATHQCLLSLHNK